MSGFNLRRDNWTFSWIWFKRERMISSDWKENCKSSWLIVWSVFVELAETCLLESKTETYLSTCSIITFQNGVKNLLLSFKSCWLEQIWKWFFTEWEKKILELAFSKPLLSWNLKMMNHSEISRKFVWFFFVCLNRFKRRKSIFFSKTWSWKAVNSRRWSLISTIIESLTFRTKQKSFKKFVNKKILDSSSA